MSYVRRSHQMCDPISINGIGMKIHMVNYREWPDHFDDDLQLLRTFLKNSEIPENSVRVGFAIAHLVEKNLYVTIGRWKDTNVLQLQMALKGEEDNRIYPWSSTGEEIIDVCIWDLKIIEFERSVFVSNMIEPDTPNPSGYLDAKMTGNDV